MTHQTVIRGGRVVDGTGAEPEVADIAVDGGVVTAIGRLAEPGEREIDATGAIVTPGFVDLHTHFDAQIGWDPMMSPSSTHGVTTALMGNCGMTFAPVRPGHAGALAHMMQAVEDVPADVILGSLPWDWEDFGGYLDAVEGFDPALNVAGLVGHSALRYFAMGDDGVDGQPSPSETGALVDAVTAAMDAGAAGVSTSRFLGHRLTDGRHVPGTFAAEPEVLAIADAVGARGLFQAVINVESIRSELELLRTIARRGGRVLYSVGVGDSAASGDAVVRLFEGFVDEGLDIHGMIAPRGSGLLVGLGGTLLPWRSPRWAQLHRATPAERLAALHDADRRRSLIDEAAGVAPFMPAAWLYPLGVGEPRYTDGEEASLAALAARAGESEVACFVRMSLESDGREMFNGRLFNRNIDAVARALQHDRVLPGLGDAGAHVGQVMDAGWTTFWLGHWVRDRGSFSLAEGVRRVTSAPAALLGLDDRGVLRVGAPADINVIDLDRLAPGPVELVNDLPGGAPRFTQSASGVRATLVNGAVTLRDDRLTGTRPGTVLRRFGAHDSGGAVRHRHTRTRPGAGTGEPT